MGRKKKVDEENKDLRYLIIDIDNMKESDKDCDCINCFCHKAIDIDVIPEDILDRLDPEYIKPRLGFDIENKKIIITTVLNLCQCSEEDEIDEDAETIKLDDAILILP